MYAASAKESLATPSWAESSFVLNFFRLKLRMKDVLEKFLPYVGHGYTVVELVGE